jgi:N-acetylglutamate synthase-like GNAT family acetyltransferase
MRESRACPDSAGMGDALVPYAAQVFAQPLATWERDGLKAALHRVGLPSDDIDQDGPLFWRFERDDVPVGFAGLEVHGQDALLRSLVTLPPVRLRGVGAAMVAKIETEAVARSAKAIYLLTQDNTSFFAKLGYTACDRTRVPALIGTASPFAAPGAAAATVMMKQI